MSTQEITNKAFITRTNFIELIAQNGMGQKVAVDMWKVVQKKVQEALDKEGKVLPSKNYYPTDLVLKVLDETYGISRKSLRRA